MRGRLLGLGWVTPGGLGPARAASGFGFDGELPEVSRKEVFAEPDRRFGRLDPFSRLGLAAAVFALRDAGREEWREKRPIGIIASTRFGCLATDIDYFDTVIPDGGRLASPNLFAYTLPNCFLGEAAIRLGLTGASFILSGDGPGRLGSLRLALESLEWGEEEAVLAGFCDLPAPLGVAFPADESPGAVFAVLSRQATGGYGELTATTAGSFLFNGAAVKGWSALVEAALLAGRG